MRAAFRVRCLVSLSISLVAWVTLSVSDTDALPWAQAAPLSSWSREPIQRKQPAKLRVVVNHPSAHFTYLIEGKRLIKGGHRTKVFALAPGRYKVTASKGQVRNGLVRVRQGRTATVRVFFPREPGLVPWEQPIVPEPETSPSPTASPPASPSPTASTSTPPPPPPPPPPIISVAGPISRVSTDQNEHESDQDSGRPVWSPDGRYVAFQSRATNLVPGDMNRESDIFVKELATGNIERVSTNTTGEEANGGSYEPQWAPDGARLAFTSAASNLVSRDWNSSLDVFVKQLDTGDVRRVSTGDANQEAAGDSITPRWSPDGHVIAFVSNAKNLEDGDSQFDDVFTKDLRDGAVTLISRPAALQFASGHSSEPSWSPDGSRIAFSSWAWNLVPGDNNTNQDIFIKNLGGSGVTRISVDKDGKQVYGNSWRPSWSSDGNRILFDSSASGLVEADTGGINNVYIKSLSSAEVDLVSSGPSGEIGINFSAQASWSPDGTQVLFVSGANNWLGSCGNHIFRKTLASGELDIVSTNAEGVVPSCSSASNPAWSPDGESIAFASNADSLVSSDRNGAFDVFIKTPVAP